MTPIRVLHCPHGVAGNARQLARSERELGLDSHTLTFAQTPTAHGTDEFLWEPGDGSLARERKRWALLRRVIRDFDVVHFNFGSSLMPEVAPRPPDASGLEGLRDHAFRAYARTFEQRDLLLLKRAGKAIFVTYQGDDARQGDYCASHYEISPVGEVEPGYYSPESDRRKRRRIARFDRVADGIYGLNPDLLNVLPKRAKFMAYAQIDPREWEPAAPAGASARRPVVIHAPTHRGVKGTRFILDAVDRLQRDGVDFEFVLVEGLTWAEARALYARADLAVDQLLAGWYGGFAVELMALGRPVVAYMRDADFGHLPGDMRAELPLVSATPGSIEAVLRDLLTGDRGRLAEIGQRSRRFVERWHDPRRIAESLRADYEAALARRRSASA